MVRRKIMLVKDNVGIGVSAVDVKDIVLAAIKVKVLDVFSAFIGVKSGSEIKIYRSDHHCRYG